MQRPRASIFRSEALEHYVQSREKSVLPRITRPPVLLCLWVLLGLCMIALVVAYLGQVPVYVDGSGIVLEQNAIVVVFLPTSPAHPLQIHAGAPVRLQIGTRVLNSTIERVEPGVFSPAAAQQRYGLVKTFPQVITGPSIAASVGLDTTSLSRNYTGSVVDAQVQVGTTRVLSLMFESANGE